MFATTATCAYGYLGYEGSLSAQLSGGGNDLQSVRMELNNLRQQVQQILQRIEALSTRLLQIEDPGSSGGGQSGMTHNAGGSENTGGSNTNPSGNTGGQGYSQSCSEEKKTFDNLTRSTSCQSDAQCAKFQYTNPFVTCGRHINLQNQSAVTQAAQTLGACYTSQGTAQQQDCSAVQNLYSVCHKRENQEGFCVWSQTPPSTSGGSNAGNTGTSGGSNSGNTGTSGSSGVGSDTRGSTSTAARWIPSSSEVPRPNGSYQKCYGDCDAKKACRGVTLTRVSQDGKEVIFDTDFDTLDSSDDDQRNSLYIHQVDTGRTSLLIGGAVYDWAMSPTGDYVVANWIVGNNDREILLIDRQLRDVYRIPPPNFPEDKGYRFNFGGQISVSNDGQYVTAVQHGGYYFIYSVDEQKWHRLVPPRLHYPFTQSSQGEEIALFSWAGEYQAIKDSGTNPPTYVLWGWPNRVELPYNTAAISCGAMNTSLFGDNELFACRTHSRLAQNDLNRRTDAYLYNTTDGSYQWVSVGGACTWDDGSSTFYSQGKGDGDAFVDDGPFVGR